jgi:hypothetical protein
MKSSVLFPASLPAQFDLPRQFRVVPEWRHPGVSNSAFRVRVHEIPAVVVVPSLRKKKPLEH